MNQFHLSPHNLPNLMDKLKQLDPTRKWVVSWSEKKSKRSLEQNSRLWKLYKEFGNYLGLEADEVHQLMGYKFLRYQKLVNNGWEEFIKSTTKLTTKEMGEYQDAIERYGAHLGFLMDWHDN